MDKINKIIYLFTHKQFELPKKQDTGFVDELNTVSQHLEKNFDNNDNSMKTEYVWLHYMVNCNHMSCTYDKYRDIQKNVDTNIEKDKLNKITFNKFKDIVKNCYEEYWNNIDA